MKKQLIILTSAIILLVGCNKQHESANSQNNLKQDGSILPFPTIPSTSQTGETLAESKLAPWPKKTHLQKDAPNVLIVLIDDVGFGISETFGGEVATPALNKLAEEGIIYTQFHTTAICSPTRASLLTGRNHTRVGSGTIAERAVNFDGYTGIIPKTSATIAEVLKNYGYNTSAFGKWHNSPANQTTAMGPKDFWPNGYGFEYFYGFMAGETSQYEPRLFENYNPVEPPHDPKYHLTEDMADKGLKWLGEHKAYAPDKPFFMYWSPGAVHGPHHVFKEWSEKYKGKFDEGWDAYRERVYKRQLEMGIIPEGTLLTPRDSTMVAWKDIPEKERAFQLRLMEIFAGFVEHTDHQVAKLIDGMDEMGYKDNTIVIYIFGDNGSSAEGQQGSISELLAQNQIPNTIEQQIEALNKIGGLDALGTNKVENMYHASWAWAGSTPFKSTKLVAAHFGGTRNPMVISWPKGIKPDNTPRTQFLHVNDIAPTLYDILNIPNPKVVNGFEQDPIDGKSFAATFTDANAENLKKTQFFDNNGSRGVYHEGWFASTFGPLYPWLSAQKGLADWDSEKDVWQLYDLSNDFSQATDVSEQYPEKLAELQQLFLTEAKENKVFPIGAGIWLRLHPEDIITSPYTEWHFDQNTTRMPEFAAPGLGKKSNTVVIDLEVNDNQNGVLYALGGIGGGLTCYMENGYLKYEYNMMIIHQFKVASASKIKKGKHTFEITTVIKDNKPGAPAKITLTVDGKEVGNVQTLGTVPAAFSASETLDVGIDLGSPVSFDYLEKAPFKFDNKINAVHIKLL
ncbi:arylsulfatase [Lutibacter holmesii]|uniref:Arylsulfatase n=1 Tax=Lutibacter holmesii TaxID=1137985 RepID=A0ABW3WM72_9FLAO